MDIQAETNFSYPFPPFQTNVNGNAESILNVNPDSGYSFPADGNNVIRLTLNSTNQLASLRNSYWRFKVKTTGAEDTSGFAINSNGLASCIDRVRVLVSGVIVDDVENYGGIVMDESY